MTKKMVSKELLAVILEIALYEENLFEGGRAPVNEQQTSEELAQEIVGQFSHFDKNGFEWVTGPDPNKLRHAIVAAIDPWVRRREESVYMAAIRAAADECIKVMNSPLVPVEPCAEELCAQRILGLKPVLSGGTGEQEG